MNPTSTLSHHLGRVPPVAAGGKLHEFVPVMGLLAAAAPVLLQVVEDRCTLVVVAC